MSVITAGEALGHNLLIDDIMLKQVVYNGNSAKTGIKSRFTHPGMCDDGMGKMMGRAKNFRLEGNRVLADLHLSDFAANAPSGNLREYVLDMAEEDPESFGLSIAFSGKPIWKTPDGTEFPAGLADARPAQATSDKPFARVEKLSAVDVVDEPAANPAGLFSAFEGTTNEQAAEAFAFLDRIRSQFGLTIEKSKTFLARYFESRGEPAPNPPAGSPASQKENAMPLTNEKLAELCKAHKDHAADIVEMAAGGKTEQEIREALSAKQLQSLSDQVAALSKQQADAKSAHAAELAAKDQKIAELSAKLEKRAEFTKEIPADPGADASKGDTVEKQWAALDAEAQSVYFNNIEVFREHKRTAGKGK